MNLLKSYFEEFYNNLQMKNADRNASMIFYWHKSSKKQL